MIVTCHYKNRLPGFKLFTGIRNHTDISACGITIDTKNQQDKKAVFVQDTMQNSARIVSPCIWSSPLVLWGHDSFHEKLPKYFSDFTWFQKKNLLILSKSIRLESQEGETRKVSILFCFFSQLPSELSKERVPAPLSAPVILPELHNGATPRVGF